MLLYDKRIFSVLQPSSSPYNIAEKVQQANIDLYSNAAVVMEKTWKIKFRDEIATYEPELTDDDVNSIESDNAEILPSTTTVQVDNNNVQMLEYKTTYRDHTTEDETDLDNNMFSINEDDEVIEEIESALNVDDMLLDNNYLSVDDADVDSNNNDDNNKLALDAGGIKQERSSQKSGKRKRFKNKSRNKLNASDIVNCKNHCIEKLDFDLSMSIRKLVIHEKSPVECPLLKLQQRKCCDDKKIKYQQNLPCYNGLRSEYGLSSAELEKREKRKELTRLREKKREQLLGEYRQRKMQQNEQVFSQWLKDVAKRNTTHQKHKVDNINANNTKTRFSPKVINFPIKVHHEKVTERPKTVNSFVPRHSVKKAPIIRPHTSHASVFIEVPQKLLGRGISIGDLLINDSNFSTRKLHIVTVT